MKRVLYFMLVLTVQVYSQNLIDGHEYVDLGLPSGTLWATCNVGAESRQNTGAYFAWGEVVEKKYYNLDTYSYYNKYTDSYSSLGINISGSSYDVATVSWGNEWCMPNIEQIHELRDNCKIEEYTLNNVPGLMFYGKNGKSLFFPGSGSKSGYETNPAGQKVYIWSSECSDELGYFDLAYALDEDAVKKNNRYVGMPVRAICKNKKSQRKAWVDLGLTSGTLWGVCNIGATTSEDFGDYFAWAESIPKDSYGWNNYKYCRQTKNTLTKYCNNSNYGNKDNLFVIEKEDDVAKIILDENWSMPSSKQYEELITECSWEYLDGISFQLYEGCTTAGYKIIGKNGDYIFLPLAGMMVGNKNGFVAQGYYWTNEINNSYWGGTHATCLHLSSYPELFGEDRCNGMSIRPVIQGEKIPVQSLLFLKDKYDILVDETISIRFDISPVDATNKNLAWSSSDENVATVENGLVTATKAGETIITAKTTDGSNLSATCKVSVNYLEGTENRPYVISTVEDLFRIRYQEDAYFELANDLDLAEWIQTNTPAKGWEPIGTNIIPFKGHFDGKNHTIMNLYINRPEEYYIGLFGCIEYPAEIKNVKIANPIIKGKDCVASIVGSCDKACVVNNAVYGGQIEGSTNVGGIVGGSQMKDYYMQSQSDISENYCSASIHASSKVGGIIGSVSVKPRNDLSNYDACINNNCFEGYIEANEYVGGILGSVYSELYSHIYLKQNLVKGVITSNTYLGGICGYMPNYSNSNYSEGNVVIDTSILCKNSPVYRIAPFAGDIDNYVSVATKVYENEKLIDFPENSVNGFVKGESTLKNQRTYEGIGWSFDKTWSIDEGVSYPYLTHTKRLVNNITYGEPSYVLLIGESKELDVFVNPEYATNRTLIWNSSNESVATVEDGIVHALQVGETTITATTTDGSNLSASCAITVKPILAESITLNQSTCDIHVGESFTLTATVLPENTTMKRVTWTSSNPSVASVENVVVTAKKEGEAIIKVVTTDGSNLEASCTVRVSIIPMESIVLNTTNTSLYVGETVTLKATTAPDSATYIDIAWTSSNETVADVKDGVVTAKKEGSATITAKTTDGTELTATCKVSVSRHSQQIEWEQDFDQLVANGEMVALTATSSSGLPIKFFSGNDDIAVIFDMGTAIYLNPIGEGTTDITASQGGNDYYAPASMTKIVKVIAPDGIEEVNGNIIYNVYTLQGYKVGVFTKDEYNDILKNKTLQRGVYIVNGIKVIIE